MNLLFLNEGTDKYIVSGDLMQSRDAIHSHISQTPEFDLIHSKSHHNLGEVKPVND